MHTTKIFGPPGTGKTTKLLSVMERELETVSPAEIAFLTFTRHARAEAVDRVEKKFGFKDEQLPFFRTLHAIAYRQRAANSGFGRAAMITRPSDMEPISQRLGLTFAGKVKDLDDYAFLEPGGELGDRLLNFDHWRRHKLLTPTTAAAYYRGDDPWPVIERFMVSYDAWKHAEHLLDFTDLLSGVEPLPVKVVIVDEAQDLSLLQWRALHTYASRAERVYLAGDDDQAIFNWAGADADAFLDEPADDVQVLGQSFRVPKAVQRQAFSIIHRVKKRQPKEWQPRDDEGAVRYAAGFSVDALPKEGSIRVLYRNHFMGGEPERELRLAGIAYARNDRPAPGSEYARAMIMWERLRKGQEVSPQDANAVLAAMSVGKRKRGKYSFDGPVSMPGMPVLTDEPWFLALDKIAADEVQYLRAVLRHHGAQGLTTTPRIKLSTIHASKGTEADHVILMAGVSRRTREEAFVNPDGERRVLYVGVTRARQTLTIAGDIYDTLLTG